MTPVSSCITSDCFKKHWVRLMNGRIDEPPAQLKRSSAVSPFHDTTRRNVGTVQDGNNKQQRSSDDKYIQQMPRKSIKKSGRT